MSQVQGKKILSPTPTASISPRTLTFSFSSSANPAFFSSLAAFRLCVSLPACLCVCVCGSFFLSVRLSFGVVQKKHTRICIHTG